LKEGATSPDYQYRREYIPNFMQHVAKLPGGIGLVARGAGPAGTMDVPIGVNTFIGLLAT